MIRVFLAAVAAVALLVSLAKADNDLTKQVKSGQKILTCYLKQGETQISPDKIKYFSEGRWYFTNGSATQCEVKIKCPDNFR